MKITIHLGHMNKLAEKVNQNLFCIKIIDASKSIKEKAIVWMSQFARGIKKILSCAKNRNKRLEKDRNERNI